MIARRFILAFAVVALGACATSDDVVPHGPRYHHAEQHYSVETPERWSPSTVRGSTQFATGDTTLAKHTIVVRAAAKPAELKEGVPTTHDGLVAATEKVLRAMPGAKLGARQPLAGTPLQGARFSLTFVPRGLSARYRREHALLVGASHVYHVIYTAPVGEPVDELAFQKVVSTLTEEG